MTHSIGRGIEMINVPFVKAEANALRAHAAALDLSLSALVRRALLRGLECENPTLSAAIRELRAQHRLATTGTRRRLAKKSASS
jgi:hypothetical protein